MENQDKKEFAKELEKRTRKFAVKIIQLSIKLPNSQESRVIKNQITKSGTSIWANYREANRARSKADFKSKIKICEGESSETLYWLEIIKDVELLSKDEMIWEITECGDQRVNFKNQQDELINSLG